MLAVPGPAAPVDDATVIEVCGADPGVVCRNVLQWSESRTLAELADWAVSVPLRILLIFVTAMIVNRLVRRAIAQTFNQLSGDEALAARQRLRRFTPRTLQASTQMPTVRAAARAQTISQVLRSTASAVIYTVAAFVALGEVGINLAPLIAGAGIAGVALGFGAQSLVKDFLSGLFMLAEDQYGVGDVIDIGEASGSVEAVNLRTTRLRGVDGTVWYVPNGEIRRVGNMSQQWARAVLDIQVAYDTDLGRATTVVKEVADELWSEPAWRNLILEEPEVQGIQHLGADGIAIRLVIKTQPGEQWSISREVRRRMKERFDAEGIEIPYPQRTVWVRRDPGVPDTFDPEA